nr:acyl-CoA dehydrogenase family member 11-like [Ciona intestinalis]|eukprot:XP_002132169.1 acyl-CoA dehydrogenase family member 11-like [Ciona intestinalis]
MMRNKCKVIFLNHHHNINCVHTLQTRCKNTKYHQAAVGSFTQEAPSVLNPYQCDGLLKSYLQRNIPKEHFQHISMDLQNFGETIKNEITEMGQKCEASPPTLKQYDAWGNRINQVETCNEWNQMKNISAREGLIAHGYTRQFGKYSRIYQFAKLFLFSPCSGMYACPLAMTDGAALVLERVLNSSEEKHSILLKAFKCLTSPNPDTFWTSGQWMTEKAGGSDVANATDTFAYKQDDKTYKLFGYKWFTSATDADMALTLARVVDRDGNSLSGTKGLSLFYLETRDEDKKLPSGLNGFQVERLKDKLGTRQLPTGELLLDGTVAHMVGDRSNGIRLISGMLTVTRIHNSVWSAASMRRLLLLSKDYATKRSAFGSLLNDHPLHMQTLARMEIESRAAFLVTFEVVRLLGLIEVKEGSEIDNDMLRLLTPLAKLYTAKQAIAVASEGLESFGGAGYLEDTGLPSFLRDAQVLSIWEGTTNVLSLDTLRAIAKSKGQVLNSFFQSVNIRLSSVTDSGNKNLKSSVAKTSIAAGDLRAFINQTSSTGHDSMFLAARDFSYSLFRIYAAVLMLEHASWCDASAGDVHAANMWCGQDLSPATTNLRSAAYTDKAKELNRELVYDSYPTL